MYGNPTDKTVPQSEWGDKDSLAVIRLCAIIIVALLFVRAFQMENADEEVRLETVHFEVGGMIS